jgi:Uma2 family endonuclease
MEHARAYPTPVLDEPINFASIETEDDTPVDNLLSAKNQRLLVETLYSSWTPPAEIPSFLADANVGVFYDIRRPPMVPDVFLSLGVRVAEDWWEKKNRSYFISVFGKAPDVVIEIVSNDKGGEDTDKLRDYAQLVNVPYYVVYDPYSYLGKTMLRVYEKRGDRYAQLNNPWMPHVGLGVTLWKGVYEDKAGTWLRWCDEHEVVIPTGKERAYFAEQRANWEHRARLLAEERAERAHQERLVAQQEKEQAHQERLQERQKRLLAMEQVERERQERLVAEQEKEHERQKRLLAMERAELLAAKLRELGVDV